MYRKKFLSFQTFFFATESFSFPFFFFSFFFFVIRDGRFNKKGDKQKLYLIKNEENQTWDGVGNRL